MLSVVVYLSSVGLGLMALPREAVAAIATPRPPQQVVNNVLGAVDGGASSQGWYLQAALAAPMVVNMGALNLTWSKGSLPGGVASDYLGVRMGVLNTTAPMVCDGRPHVVLQLDSQAGDYSAKISRIGGQSDTVAARVEYTCSD